MTLPAAFPLTAGQINVELGRASDAACDITASAERALAGVASGPISYSNFFGKSAGGGGGGTTLSVAAISSGNSGDTLSFGATDANRRILVLAAHGDTATAPGQTPTCTIGGVSAGRMIAGSTGDGAGLSCGSAIFTANPSGTSGVIAVSWGGLPVNLHVLRVIGYDLASAHSVATEGGSTGDGVLSLNIPASGLVVALGVHSAGGGLTWSQITERGETTVPGPKTKSFGWTFPLSVQSGRLISFSPYSTGLGQSSISGASFAPL